MASSPFNLRCSVSLCYTVSSVTSVTSVTSATSVTSVTSMDRCWNIVTAAAQRSEELARAMRAVSFAADRDGVLREVAAADTDALIAWHPDAGWQMARTADDSTLALIDLY